MQLSSKQKLFLYCVIAAILLLRFISLGMYDLADTTESRYASIAMRMVLLNDWITPRYFFEPFWAKPPLSFWATAASFKLFGFSELAARLPHFLIMIALSIYSYSVFKKTSKDFALISCSIFTSTIMWLVLAGGVMTDAYLAFGLGMMMLTFYQLEVLKIKSQAIGYLFFIGLAICMLAKGPLGLVISGFSIAAFLWIKKGFQNGVKEFFSKLPILTGSLLAMLIFVPWYILAEIKTPGFLNYFIVGEHLSRFLVSGWKGDLYGHAHSEPIGMIWIFFLLSILPWSLYLIHNWISELKKDQLQLKIFFKDETNLYFFIWTIAPLLFFTLARNIIIPYACLSLLAFSALLGSHFYKNNFRNSKIIQGLFLIPILFLIIIIANPSLIGKHSDKKIIQEFTKSNKETLAIYGYKPRHSTYFYSRDKIITLTNEQELAECKNCFIIVDDISAEDKSRINNIASANNSVIVIANETR